MDPRKNDLGEFETRWATTGLANAPTLAVRETIRADVFDPSGVATASTLAAESVRGPLSPRLGDNPFACPVRYQ